ncbi:MAG: SIMPL domain-containing protein [Lachnospiraceae bacterium]|nr:SIMPL domain-containing protein [Lachnospiraceae bacterium]
MEQTEQTIQSVPVKPPKRNSWVSALIIGLCVIISCGALAFGLAHFKSDTDHTIAATGSASVDFEADTIIWRGTYSAWALSSKDAYKKIRKDSDRVMDYLLDNDLTEDEIVFNSVDISRNYKDNYDDNGNFIGSEPNGYTLTQSVVITSDNVENVEMISRDISSLLDQGVELTSGSPEYYYSKLDELKLDLIDKASVNARDRIDIIAKNAGANIGKLKNSSLGVFQITAKNSGTGTYSYDGAFDSTSRYKTASITVRLEYDLK